jgi:hypothetical protein
VTVPTTIGAVAVSLACIAYLAAGNAKRRRVFGLPPLVRPRSQTGLAGSGVLAPAVFLLYAGDGAAFVAWCGAVSVAGWAIAAASPAQATALGRRMSGGMAATGRILRAAIQAARGAEDTDTRLARLELRVEALEAALAQQSPPPPRRRNGGAKSSMAQTPGR